MSAATMDLLTIDEAADLMGVSSRTIRRYIKEGTLMAYRLGPHLIRIKKNDLLKALNPLEL